MYKQLIVVTALSPLFVGAQAVDQIYSDKDAVVGYHYGINSDNTNYNSADWYGAMSQPGNLGGENFSRSLIYFDLSAYPPGTVIDEATLDLYGRGPVAGTGQASTVGNIGDNECWIEQITSAWSDNTVTYNTCPSTTATNAVMLAQSTQTIQDYIGIDVTAMVQAMIDDPTNAHGFLIRLVTEDPTRGMFFCGNGYSNPDKLPTLNVTVNQDISVAETAAPLAPIVFPSPVAVGGSVMISTQDGTAPTEVRVVDDHGRTVMVETTNTGSVSWSIPEDLATGPYFILVCDPSGKSTRGSKLMVESR